MSTSLDWLDCVTATFPFLLLNTSISSLGLLVACLVIAILLVSSALISSSEVAYFSLSPNDLDHLKGEESPVSKRILNLLETPRTLLATILISNNFINIGYIIVSEYVLRNTLTEDICRRWAEKITQIVPFISWDLAYLSQAISFAITTILVTFAVVLFGEVAPKVYAKINNVFIARLMSFPLQFFRNIFFPLSKLLVNFTTIIEKKLATRTTNNLASKEEIGAAIDLTVKGDIDANEEVDILKSIVNFGDVSVKQIMQPRVDVIAVDFQSNYQELLQILRESGYSRIPVYQENFDQITGLLYAKDLLGYLEETDKFEWQELLRTEVLYVPESKKIDDLLKEFQAKRLHMAVVVDEYGGTSGIVTLEDIMEEIIGEIRDEFDDEIELEYEKINDSTYIFEGKTLLNDVCRVLGLDTNTFDDVRGDADSLAGLILEFLGRLPRKGREIKHEQFAFKVEEVDARRIIRIKITIND
ncbi:MAG: gliding motility-associated protein GldE [Bacteroidota bacterium]